MIEEDPFAPGKAFLYTTYLWIEHYPKRNIPSLIFQLNQRRCDTINVKTTGTKMYNYLQFKCELGSLQKVMYLVLDIIFDRVFEEVFELHKQSLYRLLWYAPSVVNMSSILASIWN